MSNSQNADKTLKTLIAWIGLFGVLYLIYKNPGKFALILITAILISKLTEDPSKVVAANSPSATPTHQDSSERTTAPHSAIASDVSGSTKPDESPISVAIIPNNTELVPPKNIAISAKLQYETLSLQVEQDKQYSGDDPIVRCRLGIPRKTLRDQGEELSWSKFLDATNNDEQRALELIVKAQCNT